MFNRDHDQNRALRNANDLRIPAHHYSSLMRLPIFSYPQTWNAESDKKFNPSLKMYSKQLKLAFVLRIDIFWD
jgi:hypothetical protein